MDFLSIAYLFKIQKASAILCLVAALFALIMNIILPAIKINFFNTIILTCTVLFFAFAYFVNHPIIRLFQVLIILFCGTLTMLTSLYAYILGVTFLIIGFVLAYVYRIFKSYLWFALLLAITLTTIFLVKKSPYPASNIVVFYTEKLVPIYTLVFIFAIAVLLKIEFSAYLKANLQNETYLRLGMNAGNLAHNLQIGTALNLTALIREYLLKNNLPKVEEKLNELDTFLHKKEEIRDNFMLAVKQNRTLQKEPVDIIKTINSILELARLNKKAFENIKIETYFSSETLFLEIIPFEIHSIMHNLINNAVEAMLQISDIQTLTITTLKEAAKIIIIISDTGIGFKTVDKDGIVDITKIKSSDKSIGGYGLPYVVALVKQNNGEIIFRNKAAGGAEVRLNFKAKR